VRNQEYLFLLPELPFFATLMAFPFISWLAVYISFGPILQSIRFVFWIAGNKKMIDFRVLLFSLQAARQSWLAEAG
jgi:hypothetical protein